MRYLVSCLLILLLSFGLFVNEAAAKRFGGGRSFGVQRSHSSLFSSNKTHNTASMNQQSRTNRWGGLLGGMLIGGLLASLFMGNGFANGIMTWLILGSLVFFAISFLRRRMQPGLQSASNVKQNFSHFTQSFTNTSSTNNHEYAPGSGDAIPDHFLRDAKVTFIRLQTAYDQKNLHDLSTFTVPEVFAEIKMQLDERGNAKNTTEVISLEARLLDVSKQAQATIASVQFTGFIKENDTPMTQLDEIWHFRQFTPNGEWVVGGIQQNEFLK